MRRSPSSLRSGLDRPTAGAAIWRVDTPGSGPRKVTDLSLDPYWDIVTTLPMDGDPQLFFYGTDFGDVELFTVDAGGLGLTSVRVGDWRGGWR